MKSYRLLVIFFFGLLLQFNQTIAQETPNKPPRAFSEAGNFKFQLYPIGWSENENYFAYIIHNTYTFAASPPEGYYFDVFIQDVRNDKIVYFKQVNGYDFCGDNEDCDFSFNKLWKSYNQKIKMHLVRYKIETESTLNWNKLPLTINNNFYTLRIEKGKKTENTWGSQKVTIASQNLGSKTIYEETYKKKYSNPLESRILGAFLSPSKTRSFILKQDVYHGFEGEKTSTLVYIGSHLTKGFQTNNNTNKELNKLVLSENSLGNFPLKKGMPLSEEELKNFFPNFKITKTIGRQDGPDFFRYAIGNNIRLSTPSTDNNTLEEINITRDSTYRDQYNVQLGMTIKEVAAKRGSLQIITTMHYHIYLYQKNSNIMYEMSLGTYNDYDKYSYTIDELIKYKSKVMAIHWR